LAWKEKKVLPKKGHKGLLFERFRDLFYYYFKFPLKRFGLNSEGRKFTLAQGN